MGAESPVTLCCLLWAQPGLADELVAYESRVLALLAEHGATVLQRGRSDGAEGRPDEVQFYRFPSPAALDAYLGDPRRTELAGERERVVAHTELFPVELLG